MNNTFSIQRFGLLLKRQWLEFGKIYLISLAVLLGIFIAFYGYNYYAIMTYGVFSTSIMEFRIPLFIIAGFLFITIIASTYFAHLGQKSRAILDLMIPASTFEKFMGGIFFTIVLGIVGYLLIFYITDLLFLTSLQKWYQSTGVDGQLNDVNEYFPYFFTQIHEYIPSPVFIIPLFTVSVFLLGSIYFEKFHYIKTTICVMLFSGIWAAIIAKSGQLLFEGRIPIKNDNMKHMFNEKATAEIWLTALIIVLTLIFWSITYVRLKEKEV